MNIPCSEAVCARLATDASTVRNLVGDTLALMVQNIATVTAGLVLAFTANWILSFVVLSVSSLLLIHEYIKTKFLKGFSAEAKLWFTSKLQNWCIEPLYQFSSRRTTNGLIQFYIIVVTVKYEEASKVANDAVGSIRTVASFCAEEKMMEMYQKKCSAPEKQGVRLGLISGIGLGFSYFALYCTIAFYFYVGSILVHHGKATFGEVFKVYFCLTVTVVSVSKTLAVAPDTNKARDSTASMFEILDSKPTIDSSNNDGTILETVKGDIELQQIKFRYPTRPNIQIFKDLCLSIPAEKVHPFTGTISLTGYSSFSYPLATLHSIPLIPTIIVFIGSKTKHFE
ncbi:ABC transporter B family member 9-like protein, partial [Trifolium pratense]